ncbi:MAG: hypothetical protein N2651_07030 [Fimbriimonadales bacterium]|nr:hypothetical protein [Fimbriimonadales bacterium]
MTPSISRSQQFVLESMRLASFNAFDGDQVVDDLIRHRDLWISRLWVMSSMPLRPLLYLSDDFHQSDTLYILTTTDKIPALEQLAQQSPRARYSEKSIPALCTVCKRTLMSFQSQTRSISTMWSCFSYFRPISAEELGDAVVAKYPLQPGEEYWIHHEGTMLGRLFGRVGDHLWKWDGSQMTLLEMALNRWVS